MSAAHMVRILRQYIPKSLLLLITAEIVILFGSIFVGMTLRFLELNPTDKLLVGYVWTKALLYVLVMLFAMGGLGLYQRGLRDDFRSVAFRLGLAFFLGSLLIFVIVQTLPAMSMGGATSALAFVSSAVGVIAFRLVVYQFAELDLAVSHSIHEIVVPVEEDRVNFPVNCSGRVVGQRVALGESTQ